MNGSAIIILLVIAWVAQLGLSLWQTRRFYRKVGEMRKLGRTSIGLAGSMYKGKTYGVLTVDEDDRVVQAAKLSGWTVFANLKPISNLNGASLTEILSGSAQDFALRPKLFKAFQNAAAEFLPQDDEALDAAPHPIADVHEPGG